jgi:hypothetical protein
MNITPRNFIAPTSVFVVFPGSKKATGVPLADLEAHEIAIMCDIFRREVFANAGKPDPKLPITR